MKRLFFTAFLTFCVVAVLSGQQPVRRLPGVINHPSLNLFSPFISSDGNAIVFISDNGREGEFTVSYTSRTLDWTPPVELPKHVNNRLNFLRGYSLNADGKKLYFTSAKSPVIGGYDIFATELKGNVWTNPENVMLPINSKTNDGCPSVSPDGKVIYFMRCDRMTPDNAESCRIFRSAKKQNGQWDEPQELPEFINTGNSQTPRIMADGETLIFSSDKMPGNRGGMDLYLTRFVNGEWQQPVPLDFVNSERDDQYVSVNALGRYLLTETRGPRNNWELTELLIPAHLRPKGLMKVEGTVTGSGGPASAYISARNSKTGQRVYSGRPASDGSYFFYLKEGSVYEVAFDPEQSDKTFLVSVFDLTGDKISQREKLDVTMEKPREGDEIELAFIAFAPHSPELLPESQDNLKRLVRLMKANPEFGFEIQVLLRGYRESESESDPDLTERYEFEEAFVPSDSSAADSLAVQAVSGDSLVNEWSQDSLAAAWSQDSTAHHSTRVIYHNDRTQKQADVITRYLVSQGIPEEQLTTMVNAVPDEGDETVTTVRLRVTGRKSR